MIWSIKRSSKKCREDDVIRVILEVQHELHIAKTKEDITFRKRQLSRLIMSAKKYYGIGVMRRAKHLIQDTR